MRFERALERSLNRAEMIRDLALREGDVRKARVWEVIANSRWRRLNNGAVASNEGAEPCASSEPSRIGLEQDHAAPVDITAGPVTDLDQSLLVHDTGAPTDQSDGEDRPETERAAA